MSTLDYLFDLAVIATSTCSTIMNIYIIGCLFQTRQYFFATSCLIFLISTQTVHFILFYRKAKYMNTTHYCQLRILILFICPLIPCIYYLHIKHILNSKRLSETTPININHTRALHKNDKIYITEWQKSHRHSLNLFIIQCVLETMPCIILQVFTLFTLINNELNMQFILHLSIGINIISLLPKSLLILSEIIPLFYVFRWLCIVNDILLILLIVCLIDNIFTNPPIIASIIICKTLLFTVPFVICIMIKNYNYIYLAPPCSFLIDIIKYSSTCNCFYYILKIPFLIIDVMCIVLYFVGVLLISIFIFEICNFQLIYWFCITYLHGRFIENVSKLSKLIPFDFILNHKETKLTQPHPTMHNVLSEFIYNPTAKNIGLFSPTYANASNSCIPNELFWQLLFEWMLKYKNKNDLLFKIIATNYILIKYSKTKYRYKMFEKWLLNKHKYDIFDYEPKITLSLLKDMCLKCIISKHKITVCYQIKNDLFGYKSNANQANKRTFCYVLCVCFKSWFNGIFAFIILPLYVLSRTLNVIIIPGLLIFMMLFPKNTHNDNAYYHYFDINEVIDLKNGNIHFQNVNILQWIICGLYLIFFVFFLCIGCKVIYYEWILSFCVPGIIVGNNKYRKRNESTKDTKEFIVLRYIELQNKIFFEILNFYQEIVNTSETRKALNVYIADQITLIVLSYL